MGVKTIAMIVAGVVIIGAAVLVITGNLDGWVTDVWEWLWETMTSWFS
jgi:hypothetical protein